MNQHNTHLMNIVAAIKAHVAAGGDFPENMTRDDAATRILAAVRANLDAPSWRFQSTRGKTNASSARAATVLNILQATAGVPSNTALVGPDDEMTEKEELLLGETRASVDEYLRGCVICRNWPTHHKRMSQVPHLFSVWDGKFTFDDDAFRAFEDVAVPSTPASSQITEPSASAQIPSSSADEADDAAEAAEASADAEANEARPKRSKPGLLMKKLQAAAKMTDAETTAAESDADDEADDLRPKQLSSGLLKKKLQADAETAEADAEADAETAEADAETTEAETTEADASHGANRELRAQGPSPMTMYRDFAVEVTVTPPTAKRRQLPDAALPATKKSRSAADTRASRSSSAGSSVGSSAVNTRASRSAAAGPSAGPSTVDTRASRSSAAREMDLKTLIFTLQVFHGLPKELARFLGVTAQRFDLTREEAKQIASDSAEDGKVAERLVALLAKKLDVDHHAILENAHNDGWKAATIFDFLAMLFHEKHAAEHPREL